MHCPHCNHSINLCSAIVKSFRQQRTCPNCQQQVQITVNSLRAMALFPIVIVFHLTILGPVFAIYGSNMGTTVLGFLVTIAFFFALELRGPKALYKQDAEH